MVGRASMLFTAAGVMLASALLAVGCGNGTAVSGSGDLVTKDYERLRDARWLDAQDRHEGRRTR